MSSKTEAIEAKPLPRKEVVTGFDPVELRAPFFLRCGAIAFDYLLFIVFPVAGLLLSRMFGNDGARLLSSDLNNVGWLIAIIVGISNILLLPMVAGQSLGKMFAGLRIVSVNGERAGVGKIALRQTLGYLLTIATGLLGLFISVFSSKGRALHDYLTGTMVVYGAALPKNDR